MKKEVLLVGALACALGLPLMGCNGTSSSSGTTGDDASQDQSGDFDAYATYWGQWRGSVETTGESVYGNTSGKEQMLDVNLEKDGSCSVEPLEAHADLLTDEGTWDGTESEITLHLSSGDIVLEVTGSGTAQGTASDFDIDGFDVIKFDFYG